MLHGAWTSTAKPPALQGQPGRFDRHSPGAGARTTTSPPSIWSNREGRVMARAEAGRRAALRAACRPRASRAADAGRDLRPRRRSSIRRALPPDGLSPTPTSMSCGRWRAASSPTCARRSSLVSYREVRDNRGADPDDLRAQLRRDRAAGAGRARSGWAWPRPTPSPRPVARLVQAAGRVAGGDLSARVDADSDPDEIAVLSRAFNSMTQRSSGAAGGPAPRRRRGRGSGASSSRPCWPRSAPGVIGLDADGRISAANRQAALAARRCRGDHGRGRKLLGRGRRSSP